MLQTIRNAADNILFRALLVVIVVTFAVWGIKDNINGRNIFNVVTFKNIDPITTEEFLKTKAAKMSLIQKLYAKNLSPDDLKEINKIVLDQLVTERLLTFLTKEYNLNFNDKTTAYLIKQITAFRNKNGEFDIELLRANARNLGMNENEYSEYLKQKLMHNTILDLFASTAIIPKALVQNIVDFMSKESVVDIASIDLNNISNISIPTPTHEQLEAFYKENPEFFVVPEKRNIAYLIINHTLLKPSIVIKSEDIRQFFEDNKEEFNGRSFATAQPAIEDLLKTRAAEELMNETVKKLEDDVAAGSSLSEIAQKFKLHIQTLNDVNAISLTQNKDIGALVDKILLMQDKELSYPLELPDAQGIALVEVRNITSQKTQDLRDIENLVSQKWKEETARNLNMKIMQDFVATTTDKDFQAKAAELKLVLKRNYTLQRANLAENKILPPEMLVDIFDAPRPPYVLKKAYQYNNKIFTALVVSQASNKKLATNILKNSGEHIENKMRESLFMELISAVKEMQDVRIDETSPVLQVTPGQSSFE